MFIQIRTDNQVESDGARDARIEEQVRQRLSRFESRITDIEIHVADLNGARGGASDLRCTLEARVSGIEPIAVTECGSTVDRAIDAAARKAVRAIDHQIGRREDARRH